MTTHRLGVGVLGLGYWGPNLAKNVAASKECRLTGLCDRDAARLEHVAAEYPGVRQTRDVDDLLRDPAVEAVAVATPVDSHYGLARTCLEAGRHVLIEKPMTRSAAEAESLIELAEVKGLTLMVDHTFNYTGAVTKLKEIMATGSLGDILYWDSVRVNLGLFQHDVNVVWDLAPHDLSIMDYVLDVKPTSVQATGVAHYSDGLENIAYITLRFTGGTIAHFHVNWLAPVKIRTTLIGGTKKMIVFDDMETVEKLKVYDKGVNVVKEREGIYYTLVQYRMGDMFAPHIQNVEALSREVAHFARVVRGEDRPISGGDAGLRVVRILEAAERSMREGGEEIRL